MEEEVEIEELRYEMEIVQTDDPMTLVLVCVSSQPLSPNEYSQALISYAQQISSRAKMEDISNTLN